MISLSLQQNGLTGHHQAASNSDRQQRHSRNKQQQQSQLVDQQKLQVQPTSQRREELLGKPEVVDRPRLSPPPPPTPVRMNAFKSATLDRLDQLGQRRFHRHQQSRPTIGQTNPNKLQAHGSLQRTHSSIGYYHQPSSSLRGEPIYAPASIAAGPADFRSVRRPPLRSQLESHHYAATSVNGPARGGPPSVAGSLPVRSGRESALGQLFERIGDTLRRKPKRSSTLGSSLTPGSSRAGQKETSIKPEKSQRLAEAEQIYAEGAHAIDSNAERRPSEPEVDPSQMMEGESRLLLEEQSRSRPEFTELVDLLRAWINDELASQRLIVRDLPEDLYDGQILAKLVEKLQGAKLDLVEVTQNETSQRRKLSHVLDCVNRMLSKQARWAKITWSPEGIHSKNIIEIIQLLIALALFYKAPLTLPKGVQVDAILIRKLHGRLIQTQHQIWLTGDPKQSDASSASALWATSGTGRAPTRDVFDTLVEHAPDKLQLVQQTLVNFVDRHLNKVNLSCVTPNKNRYAIPQVRPTPTSHISTSTLDPTQFSDGILLVFLVASLEGYFVPLGHLFTANGGPVDHPNQIELSDPVLQGAQPAKTELSHDSYVNSQPIQKLHNVNLALGLIEETGIDIKSRVRAEDIVNGNLKSLLRVLYALFSRYKHL